MNRFFNKGKRTRYYKKSKYSNVEKVAYHMGQVARGLKNPDCRVYQSYQSGLKGKKARKPLI